MLSMYLSICFRSARYHVTIQNIPFWSSDLFQVCLSAHIIQWCLGIPGSCYRDSVGAVLYVGPGWGLHSSDDTG